MADGRKVRAPEGSVAGNTRPIALTGGEDYPSRAQRVRGQVRKAEKRCVFESHRDESLPQAEGETRQSLRGAKPNRKQGAARPVMSFGLAAGSSKQT